MNSTTTTVPTFFSILLNLLHYHIKACRTSGKTCDTGYMPSCDHNEIHRDPTEWQLKLILLHS